MDKKQFYYFFILFFVCFISYELLHRFSFVIISLEIGFFPFCFSFMTLVFPLKFLILDYFFLRVMEFLVSFSVFIFRFGFLLVRMIIYFSKYPLGLYWNCFVIHNLNQLKKTAVCTSIVCVFFYNIKNEGSSWLIYLGNSWEYFGWKFYEKQNTQFKKK